MRSALIAGVAAVGIVAALPNGPTVALSESRDVLAASVIAPPRVSFQDVDLKAYIPLWTDLMVAIDVAALAVEPIVSTGVNIATSVVSLIPLVSVLAPQISIFYNYLISPLVMYPLTCGALFLGTLDVGYLTHMVSGIVASLTVFVQAQIAYFLGGGWLPFAAGAAAVAPFAAVAKSSAGADLAGSGTTLATGGDAPTPADIVDSPSDAPQATPEVAEVSTVVSTVEEPVEEATAATESDVPVLIDEPDIDEDVAAEPIAVDTETDAAVDEDTATDSDVDSDAGAADTDTDTTAGDAGDDHDTKSGETGKEHETAASDAGNDRGTADASSHDSVDQAA